MKPIIEVNHVWKEYQKGIDRRYKSLRETLVNMPGRLFGEQKEKFWALEDIDFKVEAGESVGIIGRNGAGKSTLLKILSRITPPTEGEIILRGRVASLLEVGTGFHPELTGRENVFFNGSILGMKHAEIKRKFDEIVDFSGVESFIDTPLKHYSSGMQMRLAFSVAAHLDSEIILIDEVLAVGDAEFQKKCKEKIKDLHKSQKKTILIISHNNKILFEITNNCIIIDKGRNSVQQSTLKAIEYYVTKNLLSNEGNFNFNKINSNKIYYLSNCQFESNIPSSIELSTGQPLNIIIDVINNSTNIIENVMVGLVFKNSFGTFLTSVRSDLNNQIYHLKPKVNHFSCLIKKLPLSPGNYSYDLILRKKDYELDIIIDAGNINVRYSNFYLSDQIPAMNHNTVLIDQIWT